MMKKKTTFGFALACVLVAAAIAFAAGFMVAGSKVKEITKSEATAANDRVAEVEKVIHDNYLGTINEADLVTGMCKGYVEGLGDSSVKYLTAAEYESLNKPMAGETIIYKNFGKGIGYIQFMGFEDSTKTSFSNALNDFSGSSISKVDMLVFDLRNCAGGNIEVAAQLLDMLLPEGETIAGVDKNGKRTVLYTSDQSEINYDVAVLVNGNTAGPAEIFASTLNAYGKAIIVGTTTAGDCAKTDVIPLSTGDYVLIPNMYYVTKGQQTYSGAGVVPTNVVELSVSDQKAYDSGMLDLASDPQFLAAVKALGVNDIILPPSMTTSSDTDSSKNSSDSDKNSSDSDSTSSDSDSDSDSDKPRSSDSDDEDEDSDSDDGLDPHWDDDEYWASQTEGNNRNNGDGGYYDEDGDYVYYDNNDYDEEEDW